jgi:small subunit ribosomal protein S6
MNKYEIMMILKPDLEDEARASLVENFKGILTNGEGVVDNVSEEMGLRELAYEIKDYTKGFYVVIDTHTTPANIAEFERLSRINANVLRHLTLRRD